MKKNPIIFFNLLFSILTANLFAQGTSIDLDSPVPLDPKVVLGKLDNGLTYYIRRNEIPKERAEFYLVVNAGAIQEDDDQNGLAHFCEHMAFNGTKNFPKKGVLNFMESIGVPFGHGVNAFTNTDVTCYNLHNVPTTSEANIDTSLFILRDWSHYVSYEDEEIDLERGVIHEEWRTRGGAGFRISNKVAPILYKDSKYAERNIIGELDVVDNCDPDLLRKFYNGWYRPDLQAVIVIGDIDIREIEKKIKSVFSEIPKVINPKERKIYEVPDNDELLIGIATDKEAQNIGIIHYYKHDVAKKKNQEYYRQAILHRLYNIMISARLNELVQKEDPPFIYAFSNYSGWVRSKDAHRSFITAKNDDPERGFKTVLIENERVKRHGFTTTELERNKTSLLRYTERAYKERDKEKSSKYVWECYYHFLINKPMPGIEFEYEFVKNILPGITLEEINQLAKKWMTDNNQVIIVTGPEKEGIKIPTEEDIKRIVESVKSENIEPYKDLVSEKPLLSENPVPLKVIKEQKDEAFDAIVWTLENGVTVILKQTDFKKDEILLSAYSPGGGSLCKLEDNASAMLTTSIIDMSGLGEFSNIELQKKLAGKVVWVSPWIFELEEGISGSSSPEDFETMLKLIYLYFTSPRDDEIAYSAYMTRMKAMIENKNSDPNSIFYDSTNVIMANYHPRKKPLSLDLLEEVKLDKIQAIYKDRFADASDFTFIFVGNINPETAKPLIETYLGGLPSINRKENWQDLKIRPPKGIVEKEIILKMETPKSTVFVNFNGNYEYNIQNKIHMDVIEHILDLRYVETIREEQGGSYGVAVWVSQSKYPVEAYGLNMRFDCDPEKQEILTKIIYEEIEKLKKDGPTETDLNKTKEFFLKSREVALKENNFWTGAIRNKYYYNIDIISTANFDDIIKGLTTESIRETAQKFLNTENHVEIIMNPNPD